MITREEAEQIAEQWVGDSATPAMPLTATVHEFDLGYVVWGQQPPNSPPLLGLGRGIIDRQTGELSVWPSLPVETIVAQFRANRVARPPAPRTWDPAEQARRDLRRVATPANATHMMVGGRLLVARSVKGDVEPNHHRLVQEFLLYGLTPEHRERGYVRCSEAATLSDALHAEDARRAAAREPPITLEQSRTNLFRGAGITTYRVREPGDPVGGQTGPPCISCALLGEHFGCRLSPRKRSHMPSPSANGAPAIPDRFPAEVAEVLRRAGWARGRRTEVQTAHAVNHIVEHVGQRGARVEVFDAAIEALTEFGWLSIIQGGPGQDLRRRPFALDPTQVVATAETLTDLGRVLDTKLFPLGMEGDHDSILAIDESGRVFALDHAGEWLLGDSIDAALTTLITGTKPARVNDHGHIER